MVTSAPLRGLRMGFPSESPAGRNATSALSTIDLSNTNAAVTGSVDLANSTIASNRANTRALLAEYSIKRGDIVTADQVTLARSDGRLGPRLRKSVKTDAECAAPSASRGPPLAHRP